MTWSYSGNPSSSDKDKVRFLIGDTNPDEELLQDEEIQYLIDISANVYLAAASAARAIGAKFSREADVKIGDYSISANQRANTFFMLANELEGEGKKNTLFKGLPYAGGIRISDKKKDVKDSDTVKPSFTKDLMDNR